LVVFNDDLENLAVLFGATEKVVDVDTGFLVVKSSSFELDVISPELSVENVELEDLVACKRIRVAIISRVLDAPLPLAGRNTDGSKSATIVVQKFNLEGVALDVFLEDNGERSRVVGRINGLIVTKSRDLKLIKRENQFSTSRGGTGLFHNQCIDEFVSRHYFFINKIKSLRRNIFLMKLTFIFSFLPSSSFSPIF
jgi:hypothetical protein